MATTVSTLLTAVCGYMQRKPSDFVRTFSGSAQQLTDPEGVAITDPSGNPVVIPWPGVVDLLLIAANNARLFAERAIDFEWSKTQAYWPTFNILSGTTIDDAVDYNARDTKISLKKVITAYLVLNAGGQIPVQLWSKKRWTERVARRYEFVRPTDTTDIPIDYSQFYRQRVTESPFIVVQDGKRLFLDPADPSSFSGGTTNLAADVVTWLDPYVDGTETDFLLDFAFDWMMYRCVQEMNFFLKEESRVTISQTLVDSSWNALVKWNNELQLANVDDVARLD